MKSRFSLTVAAAIIATATASYSQESSAASDTRCWFAGKSFTQGATFNGGSKPMICSDDRQWVLTSDATVSSICFYEDKLYGIGSVIAVKDGPVLQCAPDGVWIGQP